VAEAALAGLLDLLLLLAPLLLLPELLLLLLLKPLNPLTVDIPDEVLARLPGAPTLKLLLRMTLLLPLALLAALLVHDREGPACATACVKASRVVFW
jgi:hypothetical protein